MPRLLFRSRACALALTAVGAFALGALWLPSAQSQIRANPSYQPVGTASSGSGSTAWFHEPGSGRVIACHMAAGPIQCQSARLPQESP